MFGTSIDTTDGGAAPGWPRARRPVNVAFLGWARLSSQAWEGSGYNLAASELARGLAMSGHQVSYLASGMTYRLHRGPRIVHREDWGGIRCFEYQNSPNLSPAYNNFTNLKTETSCPAQTKLVLAWLDQVGAEVVHVHSLEGYSLDLIGAIEGSGENGGRRVIITPHNYWFICPQVDLLHQETRVCLDYDGGRRCVDCLTPPPAPVSIRRRKVRQTLDRVIGPQRTEGMRRAMESAGPALKKLFTRRLVRGWVPPVINPGVLVDAELAGGFQEAGGPRDLATGEIDHGLALDPHERLPAYESAPADANERILSQDHHLTVLNDYGRRRVDGAKAMNDATLVIPPSDFLRRVHVKMGVEERRTRWVRLGLPHFDQINRAARRRPYYDKSPWNPETAAAPLRFAFLGTVRPNKGLKVLADAIPLLDAAVRRRCHFLIRALGNDWPYRKILARYPEVSVWGGFDRYQLIASGGEYDVGILPHIWMENSPLVLLENLHAGKFVISSRLGGPVDFIDEPRNGLMFPGGDPAALARCITDLATGRVRVPSPREIHEATTLVSYPQHVREVESIYLRALQIEDDAKPVATAATAANVNGTQNGHASTVPVSPTAGAAAAATTAG